MASVFAASTAHADMVSDCATGVINSASGLDNTSYTLLGTCELTSPGSLVIGGSFVNQGSFYAGGSTTTSVSYGSAVNSVAARWVLSGSRLSIRGNFTNQGTLQASWSSTVDNGLQGTLKNTDGGIFSISYGSILRNVESTNLLNQNGATIRLSDNSQLLNGAGIVNDRNSRIDLSYNSTWSNQWRSIVTNSNGSTIALSYGSVLSFQQATLINEFGATVTSGGVPQGQTRIDNDSSVLRNRYGSSLNNAAGSTLNNTNGSSLYNQYSSTLTNTGGAILNNLTGASLLNSDGSAIRNESASSIVNQRGATIVNSSGSNLTNTGRSSILNEGDASLVAAYLPIIQNTGAGTRLVNEGASTITNRLGGQIRNENGATLLNSSGAKIVNRESGSITNTAATITNTGTGTSLSNESGAYLYNNRGATLSNENGASLLNSGFIGNEGTLQNSGYVSIDAPGRMAGAGTFRQTSTGALAVSGVMAQSSIELLGGYLYGDGRLIGQVTMQNAQFFMGISRLGDFNVDGNLSALGSTFVFKVQGPTYIDQLLVSGNTLLSGSTLRFDFGYWGNASEGSSFDFLHSTNTLLTNVTVEAVNLRQGLYASVSQVDGGLRMTVVPEPSSWLLAMGGILSLAASRFKRRVHQPA